MTSFFAGQGHGTVIHCFEYVIGVLICSFFLTTAYEEEITFPISGMGKLSPRWAESQPEPELTESKTLKPD